MTHREFMDQMTNRYGKPKNDMFASDIMRYLEDEAPDCSQLYNIIIDHYEYENFPNRSKVKKLWQSHGGMKTSDKTADILRSIENFHRVCNNKTATELFNWCEKIYARTDRSFSQIEFISRWETLYYHWTRMREEGANIDTITVYCEKVKESIIRGEVESFMGQAMPDKKRSWETVTFDEALPLHKYVKVDKG